MGRDDLIGIDVGAVEREDVAIDNHALTSADRAFNFANRAFT
jgi:hypothetical protein